MKQYKKNKIQYKISFENSIDEKSFNDRAIQYKNDNMDTTNILKNSQIYDSEPLDLSHKSNLVSKTNHYYPSQYFSHFIHSNNSKISHSTNKILFTYIYSRNKSRNTNLHNFKAENNNTMVNPQISTNISQINNFKKKRDRLHLAIEKIKKDDASNKIRQNPTRYFNLMVYRYFDLARRELDLQIICKIDRGDLPSITYINAENIFCFSNYYQLNYIINRCTNLKYIKDYLSIRKKHMRLLGPLLSSYYMNLKNKKYSLLFNNLTRIIKAKVKYIDNLTIYLWNIINLNCNTTFNVDTNLKEAIEFLKDKEIYDGEVKNLLFIIYKMKLERLHHNDISQIIDLEKSKLKYNKHPKNKGMISYITSVIRKQIAINLKSLSRFIDEYKDKFEGDSKDYIYEDQEKIERELESAIKICYELQNK